MYITATAEHPSGCRAGVVRFHSPSRGHRLWRRSNWKVNSKHTSHLSFVNEIIEWGLYGNTKYQTIVTVDEGLLEPAVRYRERQAFGIDQCDVYPSKGRAKQVVNQINYLSHSNMLPTVSNCDEHRNPSQLCTC
jgi:hypothetical protein